MSAPVDSKTQQFAVISVHSAPYRERLVLAYGDEKSLRDCLADASILALGYHSREEALANIDRSPPRTCAPPRNESAGLRDRVVQRLRGRLLRQWPSAETFDALRRRSMIVQLLQHSFAFVIVLIYSKNVFSAMVRGLVTF